MALKILNSVFFKFSLALFPLIFYGCTDNTSDPPIAKASEVDVLGNAFFESAVPDYAPTENLYISEDYSSEDSTNNSKKMDGRMPSESRNLAEKLAIELEKEAVEGKLGRKKEVEYAHDYEAIALADNFSKNSDYSSPSSGNVSYGSDGRSYSSRSAKPLESSGQMQGSYNEVRNEGGREDRLSENLIASNNTNQAFSSSSILPPGEYARLPNKKEKNTSFSSMNRRMIERKYPNAEYVSPNQGVVVAVLPFKGMPPGFSKRIKSLMIAYIKGGTVTDNVIARSNVYILQGEVTAAAGQGYSSFIAKWYLKEMRSSKIISFFVQEVKRNSNQSGMQYGVENPWNYMDEGSLRKIAGHSVNQMAKWLVPSKNADDLVDIVDPLKRGSRLEDRSLYKNEVNKNAKDGSPLIWIRSVEGAASDGNQRLWSEIKKLFSENGIIGIDGFDPDAYILDILVSHFESSEGDMVRITWRVSDYLGEIGEVLQQNKVPASYFESGWKDQASIAARKAYKNINAIIKDDMLKREKPNLLPVLD